MDTATWTLQRSAVTCERCRVLLARDARTTRGGAGLATVVWLLLSLWSASAWGDPTCGGPTLTTPQVLTADLHCEALPAGARAVGIGTGGSLNCQGHTIFGGEAVPATGCTDTSLPGCQSGRYGIQLLNASSSAVSFCTVTGFERGIVVNNSPNYTIYDATVTANTRYGGDLVGAGSSGLWQEVAFVANGDEGVHLSGPFTGTNTLDQARAIGNHAEGFYCLHGNGVHLTNFRAENNGAPGAYLKACAGVVLNTGYLEDNAAQGLHLFDDSDGGSYSNLTLYGGRVKLQANGGLGPTGNTFDHVCVAQHNGIPASTATDLSGVAPGDNAFTTYTIGPPYPLTCVGTTFQDVPLDHVFFDFVDAIVSAGITGGCSTSPPLYCPDDAVFRNTMAVFLLRGIHGGGYQPPAPTGTLFVDVPVTLPFANFIEELGREGITGGCGGGAYCPDAQVTRAQMAVFLLRSEHGAGYQPPPATGRFVDVPVTHPQATWIEQLAREGITGGCDATHYCPDDSVTRGQMAVFLTRTFHLAH